MAQLPDLVVHLRSESFHHTYPCVGILDHLETDLMEQMPSSVECSDQPGGTEESNRSGMSGNTVGGVTEDQNQLEDLFGSGGIAVTLMSVASLHSWSLGGQVQRSVPKLFSVPGQDDREATASPLSLYKDDDDEGAADANKEETQDLTLKELFESKYTHVFPLYQYYCLQSVKADLNRINNNSLSELVTAQCLPGLQSPPVFRVVTSPPPLSPLTVNPCSFWQDLSEVKESGLLKILSLGEIRLQEAMFEMIGSEASYLRSLGVAVNHFFASKTLKQTLHRMEHHILFSNLRSVMAASEGFLLDLEVRLGESVVISQVGDIVLRHCLMFRSLYVPYVTNMMYQDALVTLLLQENREFLLAVKKLESDPICRRQTLKYFLVLPFQRITRLKIIMESILKLTGQDSKSIPCLKQAIEAIHKIVMECDGGVQRMKQIEKLVYLDKHMDFVNVKSIPLITSVRFLVHEGPLRQLTPEGYVPGSRISYMDVYLHLFNDLLLISLKKEMRFRVLDHAVFPTHVHTEQLKTEALGLPLESFVLRLSQNHTGHATAFILAPHTTTRSDKDAWMKALSSVSGDMYEGPVKYCTV
ncbi:rho guanine nucleotide exchange factor 19 [Salvelinus alpinus]|uniref:rho guanine nucleotide exchange factor 19 n=1 Tax=Salvelinus alpinus TaxID=8036 RepID=UPI0039FBBAAE